MNAIQFVKEKGVAKAMEVVEGAPKYSKHVIPCLDGEMYFAQREDGTWFKYSNGKWLEYFGKCNPLDLAFELSVLKRLVESIYLVKEHCTLERAKKYADSPYTAPEIKERLEQAIADYESIYSNDMGDDSHIENHISPLCKVGVK